MVSGANNNTAVPAITTATTIRAAGTGIPGATVEVYRASRNAGQVGLPVAFLGSGVVANNGTWSVPIVVTAGQRITALQITTANNTSRLSSNVTAVFEAPPAAPDARFTWAQRASTLTVDFTDTSTNTPAQWQWSFGDGTTSTERNPAKTYSQAGQYNVSLTVTNGGGSDSVTHQVTVQALPAGVTVAADAFGRTTNGWGSADVGGAYTLQGTLADYSVGSGAATMRLPSAGAVRSALLNTTSQRDVDIKVRIAVNKTAAGGAHFIYAVARRNTNNEYRPRIIFNATGTVAVGASVVINRTESVIGTGVVVSGLSQGPNQFIWLRARVTGTSPTTIQVKAWADGQAEPAAWQYTGTSSQAAVQVAGAVGLRTYLGGASTTAPVVVTFDDYSVVAVQ
jgi:PKD repeat protein